MVEEKEKVEEPKEETREEMAARWEAYVVNEVNALLAIYLPDAIHGNVGIKYINPVKASYETHTVYDETKATGVHIDIVFEFEKPMDLPQKKEEK